MSSKPSMSLGELATCEDFLNAHREYALDLVSNIEKMRQWHGPDSCLDTSQGRSCTLCKLSSGDGLLGAAQNALALYDDATKRLQRARRSHGRGNSNSALGRETLFRSDAAKSFFLGIATAGEGLRSQHETWRARLQSEVAASTSFEPSAENPQCIPTGPGDVDENESKFLQLPSYTGPRFVRQGSPRASASTSSSSGPASNSSMFVVFRRCLSPDCPCDANRSCSAPNASPKDVFETQVDSKIPPSLSGSNKMRRSKVTKEVTTAGNMNLKRLSRGTGRLGQPEPSCIASAKSASVTQQTDPSSERDASILDPRIPMLRAQISRYDHVRRALMAWCRTTTVELMSDPKERCDAELEASANEGTMATLKAVKEHPTTLTPVPEAVELVSPLCGSGQGAAREDARTTVRKLQLGDSEQEALKKRWLMARQKRDKGKDRKRQSTLV